MTDVLSPDFIDGFATALLDGGFSLHQRLVPIGRSLYGSILLLTLTWFAVNTTLETVSGEHLGAVLTRFLRFLLLAGIVAWLLDAYELVFRDAIYRGSEAVAAAVGGQDAAKHGFSTAWNVFVDLILSCWRATRSQLFYSVGSSLLAGEGAGAGLLGWALMAAFMVVAILTFVAAMIVYAIIYVMGGALVGVALALGPFFIPWLLWGATNALFFGWVRFLVVACLYKVVAVTLLSMARPVFERLTALLATQQLVADPYEPIHTFLVGVGFAVVAAILGSLMKSVPQISGALLSGTRVDTGFARSGGRAVETAVRNLSNVVAGRSRGGAGSRHGSRSRDD